MATATTLTGLQIEGNLIASDLMADVLAGDLKGQTVEAFGLPKTSKLSDEVALAWGDAKIYWAAFQRALGRFPEDDPATTVTREQWVMPLLRSLGYDPVYVAKAEVVEGQTYAISHRAGEGSREWGVGSRGKSDPDSLLPTPHSPSSTPHSLTSFQEAALLSLKICDPACGSGHFLLAAARRIGKELARIRTGEAQPGPEPLRVAIRDVIQHCIYGVDLNPLAVDLCKVALWLEGLCRGVSLNFLDHRIKCGNSLVGVLDLHCLKEGIPDEAFKPVTGDDKTLATQFKKRNKKEREDVAKGQGSLPLSNTFERDREEYAKAWRDIEAMKDDDPEAVRQKQEKYERSRHLYSWRRDRSACNLWTAAFFMPLTEHNLQLLPTSGVLENLLKGNWATQEIVDAADTLAEEKRFFHWPLEFPEVFGNFGGSSRYSAG